jgi:hypothetical protein
MVPRINLHSENNLVQIGARNSASIIGVIAKVSRIELYSK